LQVQRGGRTPQPGLFQDGGDHRFHLRDIGAQGVAHLCIGHKLQLHLQPRQGGAQLVTHVQQQVLLAGQQPRQPPGHGVEGAGQVLEFAGPGFGHPVVQPPGRQRPDAGFQGPQRGQYAPDEKIGRPEDDEQGPGHEGQDPPGVFEALDFPGEMKVSSPPP
jgi:hypothetical protein